MSLAHLNASAQKDSKDKAISFATVSVFIIIFVHNLLISNNQCLNNLELSLN